MQFPVLNTLRIQKGGTDVTRRIAVGSAITHAFEYAVTNVVPSAVVDTLCGRALKTSRNSQ